MDKLIIKAIRDHALKNWGNDGWDFVCEAFTDEELWKEISHCSTATSAIQVMGETCKDMDSYRKERRAIEDMVNGW